MKALVFNKQARLLFIDNTKLIQEICNNQKVNKLLKSTLGKTVSVASLISGTLKGNQRMSLLVSASKLKYKIFADAEASGNVRGYLSEGLLNAPEDYINQITIEQLIGDKGSIQVMKDSGTHQMFTGITDMPYRNIVDDVCHYFKQSEQTSTYISVNIVFDSDQRIKLSNGIFIQLLPGAPSNLIDRAKRVIIENQCSLTRIEKDKTFKEIVLGLFDDAEIIGSDAVQFFCGCSKPMFYGSCNP